MERIEVPTPRLGGVGTIRVMLDVQRNSRQELLEAGPFRISRRRVLRHHAARRSDDRIRPLAVPGGRGTSQRYLHVPAHRLSLDIARATERANRKERDPRRQ